VPGLSTFFVPVLAPRLLGGRMAACGSLSSGGLDLPLEHGDLMAQDQDLSVLGAIGLGERGKPAEHVERREVSQSQ
jgi:hypothetical protein